MNARSLNCWTAWKRRVNGGKWRTGRDSNPRYAFTYTRVPGVRLKPLGHLSFGVSHPVRKQIVGTAAIYTDEFLAINPNLTDF